MAKTYHKGFDEPTVINLCRAYIDGTSQIALTKEYNISLKLVYNIIHRKIYKQYDVEGSILDYLVRLDARPSRGGRPKVVHENVAE